MTRMLNWIAWALAAWIAFVFLWYLQLKFTGNHDSVRLFTILSDWLGFHGYEKVMRIGVGAIELIITILLFDLTLQPIGALLALIVISGAILFDLLSPFGTDPYHDGGILFRQACSVWLSSAVILAIRHKEALRLLRRSLPFRRSSALLDPF